MVALVSTSYWICDTLDGTSPFERRWTQNTTRTHGVVKRGYLCVGDAPNDLSMFEFAHWSVAVKGAFDSVSSAADVCSPHFHGDTFGPLVEAILQVQKNSGY